MVYEQWRQLLQFNDQSNIIKEQSKNILRCLISQLHAMAINLYGGKK